MTVLAEPGGTARPRGFLPSEISALFNRPVANQHVTDAAFLWVQRDRAVRAAHYKLKHLAKLDGRLLAHLRGLEVADAAGWALIELALADLEPGTVFVAAYLAFVRQASRQMYQILMLSLTKPGFERALRAALAWIEPDVVGPAIARLCESDSAAYRRIGLAAGLEHSINVDHEIERGVRDSDAGLRALAFRAVGAARRPEFTADLERGLRDADSECRFWAAWSLALYGDKAAANDAYRLGSAEPALAASALNIALRCGEVARARDLVRSLASAPSLRRYAIQAVGFFGDPATIPWLLDQLDAGEHARIAGEAFSMITGVDLKYFDLTSETPEDLDIGIDDADLPTPNPEALRAWWANHRSEFIGGERYLAGYPVSAAAAATVLREGYQRQRAAAAFERACHGNLPIFPVEARADWQRRALVA
jgi:uncharacterized protein (TIGR02270 family)